MQPTDAEIKSVIKASMKSMKATVKRRKASFRSGFYKADLYRKSIRSAMKFCRKALQAEGPDLKVLCQYIVGNAIFWDGDPDLKERLRKFSFHGALSYRPKIAREENHAV